MCNSDVPHRFPQSRTVEFEFEFEFELHSISIRSLTCCLSAKQSLAPSLCLSLSRWLVSIKLLLCWLLLATLFAISPKPSSLKEEEEVARAGVGGASVARHLFNKWLPPLFPTALLSGFPCTWWLSSWVNESESCTNCAIDSCPGSSCHSKLMPNYWLPTAAALLLGCTDCQSDRETGRQTDRRTVSQTVSQSWR